MINITEKHNILGNLTLALQMLESCPQFVPLIPEVRVNLVYALPDAQSSQAVAAIEGRITAVQGRPYASGRPLFGASDHMARLILEVRRYVPGINAGINFRCDSQIIEVVKNYCRDKRLLFGWIDRSLEPEPVSAIDRNSMPWKIAQLMSRYGAIPRLFYEGAGWGKEPLFVALGRDAVEVTRIAIDIARIYAGPCR